MPPIPGLNVINDGAGDGIIGATADAFASGVRGESEFGVGVWGDTRAGIGVRASAATSDRFGPGWALATDGDVLVQGALYGVYSRVNKAGYAFVGDASSGGWAGIFDGEVHCSKGFTTTNLVAKGDAWILGTLYAPGFPKSAVVKLRDGSHRALYCVESPECWFEDFGRARLVRGKARVRLDRTFAVVVRTGDYHVFLSPEGLSHGLYVSRRTRDGFEVREQHRGTSTVAFSFRIVARRKDVDAPRFKRVKPPTVPRPPRLRKPPQLSGPARPPQIATLLGLRESRKGSAGKPVRGRPRTR